MEVMTKALKAMLAATAALTVSAAFVLALSDPDYSLYFAVSAIN